MWAKLVDWVKSLFWSKELEMSIVGLQFAGKTTLVNSMATGKYEEDTIPTIGLNHRQISKGKIQMKLWDLGGQPRFRESWEKYCRNADVIIFVVDSADKSNMATATTQLHELISYPSLEGIPLLVLGNKSDLQDALQEVDLINQMDLKSIKDRKVACFSISAKNQTNIDTFMKWLTDLPKKQKK